VTRIILFLIFIGLVGGSWVAIYLVNVYQNYIEEYLKINYKWLSYTTPFIAPACLAIINITLPLLIDLLIDLERWDY
jgi:hypothetical protein